MADVSLISVNPHINHGQASVAGTRVMVTTILDCLAGGMSEAEILAAYPTLTRDGLRAAVAYGALLAREDVVPVRAE